MRKFALVSLAALAVALPATADAQPGQRSGHSWEDRGQRAVVRHGRNVVRSHGPRMRDHRRHDRRSPHFRRIDRGFMVPQFWWGPQFHVQHWQMYGFPEPMPGHRWIRYYDDALMVDQGGRVRDGRYGFDWDRYDDRWSYDERGIPAYAGDGDYHPDDRDYEYSDRQRRGHGGGDWDYSEYGRGGPGYECAQAAPSPCGGYAHQPAAPSYGYGQQGYYGYGQGCCGTVTITETTVTTGGATYYEEEIIEEEVVRTRARPRRVHRRPPPRRPFRGERG